MKSRSSSQPSSPQIVRPRGVDEDSQTTGTLVPPSPSPRIPSGRTEQLSPVRMGSVTPLRTVSAGGSTAFHITTANGPTSVQNGLRRPSNDQSNHLTPTRDAQQPNSTPSSLQNFLSSPITENSPTAWSSGVGHATTTGKSGRVIERLMNENDKLKRDLNAQLIKCQELEKSMQTFRPQIDALRQENDNLSHARGVDSSLIARRDRKIEELKADLASERARREHAEELARRREREREELAEQNRRELQALTESTKHATLHAEILETSHKQLNAEYRARAEAWKHDLAQLADGREQDRQKLAKLDVVADQMRQELERGRRINSETVELWAQLQRETKTRLGGIERETQAETERMRQLSEEMDRVVGEMRWVMGLKRNLRDTHCGDAE